MLPCTCTSILDTYATESSVSKMLVHSRKDTSTEQRMSRLLRLFMEMREEKKTCNTVASLSE